MTAIERRAGTERRVRRVSLHYPERRSGFDRRDRGTYQRFMLAYRSRPVAVAAVLTVVVALSLADLLLTLRALEDGATEVNPVMAGLLGSGPVVAGIFKMVITLAVAGGIWLLRRYRRALEASLLLLAGFWALTIYHLVGAAAAG